MDSRHLKLSKKHTFNRVQLLKLFLILAGVLLIARLFFVQIIRHEHYQSQALAEHIKKFEITAPRGIISIEDGNSSLPIVLNEQRYTIYADPKYVSDTEGTASKLASLIGQDKQAIKKELETKNSRYVVLAKKMVKDQADRIGALHLNGIGEKEVSVRTYPQGSLLSQVLGFVNDDGQGQYGIEGFLNNKLGGKTGLEKAITDVHGVPLAVSNNTVLTKPVAGENTTLTIDIGMQRLVESILKTGVDRTHSVKGSAIIMEANSGAIKAVANYPTYDPSQYWNVKIRIFLKIQQ